MKTGRQYIASLLALFMLLTYLPVQAGFLEDEIFFDDMESYAVGYVPEGITGWGSNSDKPVSVQEISGNKVIRYGNETTSSGGYGRTQYGPYEGKLWATVDLLFPDSFENFRLSFTNENAHTLCILEFNGSGRLTLMEVRDETGRKQNTVLCETLPVHSGWLTFRAHIDTEAQTIRFLYKAEDDADFTAIPGTYDFCYKNWAGASEVQKKSNLYRMQFANAESTAPIGTYFYLDNFGLYYDREIITDKDKDYVEIKKILDISDRNSYGYTFPETVNLDLEGFVSRELPVTWTDSSGSPISGYTEFDTVGLRVYKGTIENTDKWVELTLDVRNRQIQNIDKIYASAYQFDDYTLPETVSALMDDGSYKDVKVEWETRVVDTSETGTRMITGTVLPWNDSAEWHTSVTLYLGITIHGVKSVKNLYVGVPVGSVYTLPDRIPAVTENGEDKEVAVEWNAAAPDTSVPGVYNYTGKVSGFIKPVKLRVTVYEENEDDNNLLDILLEYYENVLTEGRDRTRYGVDASEPHPIFAAGINRLTGEHAMWQHKTGGNVPLTDLASQTCLLKGLMGMTQLTGDDKYRRAVYDAYKYYLENCRYDHNGLIAWGGHMAFNMATYELWDELDTDELKDHYPLFDVMYDIDPQKTEEYIKALWAAHIKDTTNLEFSRHFTMSKEKSGTEIDSIFKRIQGKTSQGAFNKDLEPFFEASDGLITFITAANDYISAAGELYALTGDDDALQSAFDLQNMYLKGRHDGSLDGKEPTGLIPFLFTKIGKFREPILDVWDDMYTNSGFGDRIKFNLFDMDQDNPYLSDFGAEYDYSIDIVIYCYNPMVMFKLAENCDEATKKYLIEEAVETLASFLKVKYDPAKNQSRPMLIDGTDLTGYVRKRTGYTGNIGVTFEPWELESDYILAFIRGYINAMEYEGEKMNEYAQTIWGGIRNMFDYYGVGDVGTAPGENMSLNFNTSCEEPFVLISLCEAYNKFGVEKYLELARVVANNIVQNRFVDGYFYSKENQLNANFNAEEPYSVMYFLASTMGIAENVPEHFGSRGYFQFDWWDESTQEAKKLYSSKLWALTVSSEILAESIELNTSELELKVGEKYTLRAGIEPENTEDQTVEWQSSDKNVCIVNEDGIVTAISPGTAQIIATAISGGCEATVTVKVE